MSAIAGMYRRDGCGVDSAQLGRMLGTLAHRGPDGSGAWVHGPVGIGHQMLHTTPESVNERLPLVSRRGSAVLTCDARIDNRNELIGALGIEEAPQTVSDSDLILAAYERWGEGCPERLLGDFAFAIWDAREERLFCARDQIGVRPFYYHASAGLFAFATEIKALLALPEVPRRLDEERVGEFLTLAFTDCGNTLYRDIRRLAPGHTVTVTPGELRIREYWRLDPEREVRLGSDEEYAEAFRERFDEAVRCRLRSAHPAGAMLSGGLDSSAIACTARGMTARPLRTFSAVFPDLPDCDERPYIDSVLGLGGFDPTLIPIETARPVSDLDDTLRFQDQAFCASNLFLSSQMYGELRKQGTRVVLEGHDGDSTVSYGVHYLNELAAGGRWLALAREARALSRRWGSSAAHLIQGYFWFYAVRPRTERLRGTPVHRAWRAVRRARTGGAEAARQPDCCAELNQEFVRRTGLRERYASCWRPDSVRAASARDAHYRTLTSAIMPLSYEELNHVAARFSVEARYPFADRRLMEFCLAIPGDQKLRDGWSRYILRRAMEGVLPPKVQWRGGKTNFTSLLQRGLQVDERTLLDEILRKDLDVVREYVDVQAFRESYSRGMVQRGGRALQTAWRVARLARWMRGACLV